ncbi:MAG: glycerate kinase type-2 family protein, partial [Vicinamibacterales bacterium]
MERALDERDQASAPPHVSAADHGNRPFVRVIAAGKASPAMAAAAAGHLGSHVRSALVVASSPASVPSGFELIVGGHPIPTVDSERGGRRALEIAAGLASDERLLVLLSGGASALMAVPAEGITLEDKRATTERLLRAGADIHALNTVRKHLSSIKGGWLAARAGGVCDALAISDVVGDDPSFIASGPTVADVSRFEDALDVLRRFGGEDAYPAAVVTRLRQGAAGAVPETPKPGDARIAQTRTSVVGSRRNAMAGALAGAAAFGYQTVRLDDPVVGDARTTAVAHVRAVIARAAGLGRPACIVSSGETTVHVTGPGKGGRNQEFALAAAPLLADARPTAVLGSVGTDGIDGPTDAAGAVADSTTIDRAAAAGLTPARFLDDNNAYAFFDALGDLIHTGPTGTNVGDLQVI